MPSLGNFDATKVEPSEAFEIIPNGDYRVAIVKSDVTPTKKNDGHYLELVVELLDEPHKGRRVFGWRLNLDNPNPKAVEIAERELSAICHATGVMAVQNSEQLHEIPFVAKIVVTKDQNGNPRNEVKGPVLAKKNQTSTTESAAQYSTAASQPSNPFKR